MRPIIRNAVIVLALIAICLYKIHPYQDNLKKGKDLQGGVSLVYSVGIDSGEDPDQVVPKVIDVLKQRIDPDGVMDIAIVKQGRDRIEITMPLPNDDVKARKKAFEDELAKLGRAAITGPRLDQTLAAAAADRPRLVEQLSAGSESRRAKVQNVVSLYDAMRAAQDAYKAETDAAKRETIAGTVAQAEIAFEGARTELISSALTAEEFRRTVQSSTKKRAIADGEDKVVLPSAFEIARDAIYKNHPDSKAEIDHIFAMWDNYAVKRQMLDDPQDLVRMLKGAGVLAYRITVDPGTYPNESTLRREIAELGPTNIRATDVRWCKINQIETFVQTKQDADRFAQNPAYAAAFFAQRGYVVEPFGGEYYMLCWDIPANRLTTHEGEWAVAKAYPGVDQLGRPAIHFNMNTKGAIKLGALTRGNVGKKMAILLDEQVYTAPRLNSEISSSGYIEGDFDSAEIQYVVRVLGSGSLQGKLSPAPLSISSVGPELGADNLRKGLVSGLYSVVIVGAFMIVYYFGCGWIAVASLLINAILILGAMALSKAAFTMPGIAGVILTFGMAVDSNVLIYERMREEFGRGADMKTAVRLGFDRALASIVDGNVTNLIVCIVLYYFGTPEIRGFAITMGIGVVATLIAALVASRLMFDLLVQWGWRKASMLPMAVPQLQHFLTPRINWIRLRYVFMAISAVYVTMGLFAVIYQRNKMLDTEFLGGTQVTLAFRNGPDGSPLTMTRAAVEERLVALGQQYPEGNELRNFESADVIPINPASDGVTSSSFNVKVKITSEDIKGADVVTALIPKFQDVLPEKPALQFAGSGETRTRLQPTFLIDKPILGAVIDRAEFRQDVRAYLGGVAIVASDIQPRVSLETIKERWAQERSGTAYSDTLGRATDVLLLEGDEQQVKSCVFLAKDDTITLTTSEADWDAKLRTREWSLIEDSLTQARLPASVQSFSASIATSFRKDAILATAVSFFFIGIYIWIRFKTPRYSIAAVVALVHDVLTVLGLLAVAELLCDHPSTKGFADTLGLLPFKIDLNTVAALLTIAGYSLNDTVIVMDRIRENRGKLPHATAKIINDSINQTFSRTLITGGTTMGSCIILYAFGGIGMRAFAFCLLTGLIVGTYSSVAVAAPIVWSRKFDRELAAEGDIVANPV